MNFEKGFIAKEYIKYIFKSINQYKIHSPFVYEIYNKIFRNKGEYYTYKEIELLRYKLLGTKECLTIKDFGARKNEGIRQVSVSRIVKNSSTPSKYGQLLFRLVNYFRPNNIIELGTSLGITTAYLAKANEKATVYTFEGSDVLMEYAKKNISKLNINNVNYILGDFDSTIEKVVKNPIDVLYIDGNHSYEATKRYFNYFLKYSHKDSIFIFDDIRWSRDMYRAWEEIIYHDDVSISFDIFRMGIVFFKQNIAKKNYVLRY